MKLSLLTLTSLTSLATAHFHLNYPTSRGFDANKMTTFPCGDLSQSSNRTKVPLSGSFPVELMLGHSQTAVEVLLSLGNDPGDNFNIVLVPTFGVKGLGEFCLPHVSVDAAALVVNVTDGMNATVQVQTNGDPAGGLYACADIQFSADTHVDTPSSCSNNTGISATAFSSHRNANESTADGQAQGSEPSSPSSSNTKSPSATSTGGAVALQTAAWGMLGAALVGGVAIL